jgi:hypothetical protein
MEEKDPMEETVGRRKTIQNLHNKHLLKKKQSVRTLDTALKRRLSMMPDNSGTNGFPKPLEVASASQYQRGHPNDSLHNLLSTLINPREEVYTNSENSPPPPPHTISRKIS